jgi:hypothetical protein
MAGTQSDATLVIFIFIMFWNSISIPPITTKEAASGVILGGGAYCNALVAHERAVRRGPDPV